MSASAVNRPWYQSGWAIAFGLLFCWPLGLLFLIMRSRSDRAFHGSAGRLLQIVGWLFLVTFGLTLVAAIGELNTTDDPATGVLGIAVITLFVAGAIAMLRRSAAMRAAAKLRRLLIDQIVNQQVTSIDEIASRLGQQPGEVLGHITEMSAGGFLPGYRVEPQERRVWRPAPVAPMQVASSGVSPALVEFHCSGCGARNQTYRTNGRVACEYCDAPVAA